MNKTILGIIIAVFVVVAGLTVFTLGGGKDKTDQSSGSASHSSSSMNNMAEPSQSQNQQSASDEVLEGEVQVDISNFEYSPSSIKIKKGTVVIWTNQDDTKHDVAPDSEAGDFTGSDLLAKGQSYSFTFNSVGTFAYHCSPHPYMKAKVEVVE